MTPRTAAGQALSAWANSDMRPLGEFGYPTLDDAILAIEAEATALALDRVERAIERLPWPCSQATRDAIAAAREPSSSVSSTNSTSEE